MADTGGASSAAAPAADAAGPSSPPAAGGGVKAAQSLSTTPRSNGKGLIASAKQDAKATAKASPGGSGAKAAAALKQQPTKADPVPTQPALKAGLHKPDIYVRIRPLAAEGGHAEDGTVLPKHLDKWDETSVTMETQYLFSKGEAKYTYPKRVFDTEASQQEVTDEMVPDLVSSFTEERTSVLFFAYGQTGTGKTRTMLGTEPSLQSVTPHEDWGVFPRVCAATFEKLAAMRAAGQRCVLTGSAIEFYLGECFDLLDTTEREANTPVQIDWFSHVPSGESCVVLETPADLIGYLAKVLANRTARSTNFNKASSEHSGSSRSHAALILTLMVLDEKTREYSQTTFTLVDLAGAERPEKVRAESEELEKKSKKPAKGPQPTMNFTPEFMDTLIQARDSGAMTQKQMNALMPLNAQTRIINFELFLLGKEVLKASEAHSKRKPYMAPKAMVTPAIKFLSAIFDGKARLAMCVTLSPAGRNAWETWFSLQYGSDLAKLHAPRRQEKPQDVDKLHKALAKEAAALRKDSDAMAVGHRYYAAKKHKADASAETLRRLELVLGPGGGESETKEEA